VTRSGLHGMLLGAMLLSLVLVGATTALPHFAVPAAEVPANVTAATVRPGALDDQYVSSVAFDWLFHTYDWDALNYESRAKTAILGVSPRLRMAFAQYLEKQREVIIAGKQTQEADITIGTIKRTGRRWQVSFSIQGTIWYGGFKASKHTVAGTIQFSIHPEQTGGRGLLLVDDFEVSQDDIQTIDSSPAEAVSPANRT